VRIQVHPGFAQLGNQVWRGHGQVNPQTLKTTIQFGIDSLDNRRAAALIQVNFNNPARVQIF
jgi:hypothetical protein